MNNPERLTIGQTSNLRPPCIDLRILVVDDDATTLAVVSSMLQIWSYKVETAKNPLDALATLRLFDGIFDLVVTDLHMPFMNGFELTKRIVKEFKIPVIMMSADEKENVMPESAQSGIAHYISKPVSPEDLKNVWQFADRAKKGKSVVIEEIRNDGPLLRHNNLGCFNQPIQLFRGGGGGGSAGIGSLLPRSPAKRPASIDKDRDQGNGRGSNKKPCHRKDRGFRHLRTKRPKKSKIVWTNSLHNRFLLAMRHLGYSTVPKKILDFMNVPGLTRENVASHLQKYRLFLKRVAENGLLYATKMLTERFMRSSFATGYPVDLMLHHAQQMYPTLFRKAVAEHQRQQQQQQLQVAGPTRPVGLSTLLMDNRPSPNIVQQPLLTSSGPNIIINNNHQASRPGFVSRNYSSFNDNNNNNNFGISATTNYNSGGATGNMMSNVLTRFSQRDNNSAGVGFGLLNNNNNSLIGGSSYDSLQVLSSTNGYNNNNNNVEIANNGGGGGGGGNGVAGMVNNSNNFGGNNFVNQDNNWIQNPATQSYELRVEDYASDLSHIAFEEPRDSRTSIADNNNLINAPTNQSAILQNPPADNIGFTAGQTNSAEQLIFGQVQGNEQGLLSALPLDPYFPRIIDQIPLQNQGIEQILQNSNGNNNNALQSDGNYFPLTNPIPLQSEGIEQTLQNPAGYNSNINNKVHPLGVDQVLQNPAGYNNNNNNYNVHPLVVDQVLQNPVGANYYVQPLGITTTDQQILQNPGNNSALPFPTAPLLQTQGNGQILQNPNSDVFPSDGYVPRFDEINPQQQGGDGLLADPFQHIDLENLHYEVDWGEFMDCLLNDNAPDLRE